MKNQYDWLVNLPPDKRKLVQKITDSYTNDKSHSAHTPASGFTFWLYRMPSTGDIRYAQLRLKDHHGRIIRTWEIVP